MASNKLVAIHWDKAQLLVASAQRSGGGLWVDRAHVVERNDDSASIAEHLKKLGITRGEATVVIPRSQVEMRQLDVPPVPASELPGLVRFQAQSQFASLSDDWALDYVPVAENGHVETVLAAALSDVAIKAIKAEIEPTGLKVKHIVIRPFSTVEMVRGDHSRKNTCLIINCFETEIDLTVSVNGYVNLSRSIRVTPPDDGVDHPNYSENIIVQETRRTIAAAMNQATPVAIEEIVICGSKENHGELEGLLVEQLGLPVNYFRPFEAARMRPAAKRSLPERDGRFTPLLGSLYQQDSKNNHAVDLLNPRKTLKANDTKRKLILAGSLIGLLLLAAAVYLFLDIRSKDFEIARLTAEHKQLVDGNKGVEELIEEVKVIDEWSQRSVEWTEELQEISERFLIPDEARINNLAASIIRDKAVITLRGQARDSAVYSQLREALEARPYVVSSPRQGELLKSDGDLDFDFNFALEQQLDARQLMVDRIAENELSTRVDLTSEQESLSKENLEKENLDKENQSDGTFNDKLEGSSPTSVEKPVHDREQVNNAG